MANEKVYTNIDLLQEKTIELERVNAQLEDLNNEWGILA